MKAQNPASGIISFRKIYLSDLNTIVDIYKNVRNEIPSAELTTEFGLPLGVAVQNKEIIGFVSATVKEPDELKLITHASNGSMQLPVRETLEAQATQILQTDFENTCQIKRAVDRLTDWLNVCNG